MTAKWKLIGSAGSLDDIQAMVIERWSWSTVEAQPTDDPKVWNVANAKGVRDGLRFRKAGQRYRFEHLI